jgi:hypothetical protein
VTPEVETKIANDGERRLYRMKRRFDPSVATTEIVDVKERIRDRLTCRVGFAVTGELGARSRMVKKDALTR